MAFSAMLNAPISCGGTTFTFKEEKTIWLNDKTYFIYLPRHLHPKDSRPGILSHDACQFSISVWFTYFKKLEVFHILIQANLKTKLCWIL